ncbi:caspase family protein, partial [Kitasatospora sp. NPDC085895]|uniref:caspase family protein n=1 Tax=Kitasatospora sp. NPDC085895 TaxID=3155057 RepID=UPI00344C2E23
MTQEPRRFLISAAVADYPKNPDWDRPGLREAREQIAEIFTEQLGYELHSAVGMNPTRHQLLDALHDFCISPQRREDDLLTVYLSCHGEILDDGVEHVLLTTESDPDDLAYTALPTANLTRAMLHNTRIRRVLLLLDACYAEQGGNQLAATALARLGSEWKTTSGSGLVLVSSAQPHQQAQAGLFPQLLDAAINSLPVAGHSPETLPLDAIVQHINDSPEKPEYQDINLNLLGLKGVPPVFLPNPRHDPRLTEVDLALQQAAAFEEEDQRRHTEFTRRLLIRAMGYHSNADPSWWFSGRHAALHAVAQWLNTPADDDQPACLVVTAAPGSGKTAVLGLIAALAHPERRRTVPLDALGLPVDLIDVDAIGTAIYAQRLTDDDVLRALGAAARVQAHTVGQLLDALDQQARSRPLTVLIDALDEAATPETLCTTVLRPLIEHARGRIRLLLGTRSYLLPRLGIDPKSEPARVVNLDDDRYADPQALAAYAMRTLLEAHPDSPYRSPYREEPGALRKVGRAVAEAAGTSFLIARITAGTLAADDTVVLNPDDPAWRASLPRHAHDAMSRDLVRRLGPNAQRAMDLLRPLAFAHGQGLPWEDIWAPLASEISGCKYSDDDLLWLRRTAGSYVVEATEAGRSAYRLYHQAMADYLRDGIDPKAVHAAFTRILTDRVPYQADATRDWSRAHPYTLGHLAEHATEAGLLDQILADSDYLVHADPRSLTPYLRHATDHTARLTAAVYRTSLNLHQAVPSTMRRQVLALDAARAGAHDLQQSLTARIPPGHWFPVWSTGGAFTPALRDTLTGHAALVLGVACTDVDGIPVAVTGSRDHTVRIWDLRTGQPLGEPLTGHSDLVSAVACTDVDGTPVAVTGGRDGTVRIWDLRTGQPLGHPLTGHTDTVLALACTDLDGTPIAVTRSAAGTVHVWNLRTGEPLTGPTSNVSAVACTDLDGTPIAVTGSRDGTVRIWDLRTGQPLG